MDRLHLLARLGAMASEAETLPAGAEASRPEVPLAVAMAEEEAQEARVAPAGMIGEGTSRTPRGRTSRCSTAI